MCKYTFIVSIDDVDHIRRELLTGWVLDDRNEARATVLQAAKVDALLSTPARSIQSPNVDDLGTGEDNPKTGDLNMAGLCLNL